MRLGGGDNRSKCASERERKLDDNIHPGYSFQQALLILCPGLIKFFVHKNKPVIVTASGDDEIKEGQNGIALFETS
ncbi:hypothetical protein [Xenorhabdus budapestensis]|uniref:Uncharacterized protein n=1 Tax=Xenorhabdus budapestensis TaxID=290110 RepID=A0A2D0J559_XENBU|nr:hypothetical protein [Xenorhabdus budapestensis]PHM29661.1 hypothetical protein Xbud_00198 [Xenorhabdus budapestensis]